MHNVMVSVLKVFEQYQILKFDLQTEVGQGVEQQEMYDLC